MYTSLVSTCLKPFMLVTDVFARFSCMLTEVNTPPAVVPQAVTLPNRVLNGTVLLLVYIADENCCDSFDISPDPAFSACVLGVVEPGSVFGSLVTVCDLELTPNLPTGVPIVWKFTVTDNGYPSQNSTFSVIVSSFEVMDLVIPSNVSFPEQQSPGSSAFAVQSNIENTIFRMLDCNGSSYFGINAVTGEVYVTTVLDWRFGPLVYLICVEGLSEYSNANASVLVYLE